MDTLRDRRRVLERTLRFLDRQQWDELNCFTCARPRRVAGAFSESMSSPIPRIDYAQHARSAIGHGAPLLHLAGDDGTAAGRDHRSDTGIGIDRL